MAQTSEEGVVRRYATDLTDGQRELLRPFVARESGPGHPMVVDLRRGVDGVLYQLRTGCPWRLPPHEFPNPNTVRYYFDKWPWDGTLVRLNDALRGRERVRAGRAERPTAGLIDRQPAKTTEVGGARGWDGGKRTTGRKRHLLTDTPGNLIRLFVTAADVADAEAAEELLAMGAEAKPALELVFGDSHYGGPLAQWSQRELGVRIKVVRRPEGRTGFVVVPKRWAVERSLAWYGRGRRLAKDYEHAEDYAESWVYLASIHCLLCRLAPDPTTPRPYSRPITLHPDLLHPNEQPAV